MARGRGESIANIRQTIEGVHLASWLPHPLTASHKVGPDPPTERWTNIAHDGALVATHARSARLSAFKNVKSFLLISIFDHTLREISESHESDRILCEVILSCVEIQARQCAQPESTSRPRFQQPETHLPLSSNSRVRSLSAR